MHSGSSIFCAISLLLCCILIIDFRYQIDLLDNLVCHSHAKNAQFSITSTGTYTPESTVPLESSLKELSFKTVTNSIGKEFLAKMVSAPLYHIPVAYASINNRDKRNPNCNILSIQMCIHLHKATKFKIIIGNIL